MILPVYQYRLNITERWSIFTKNVWNSKQCIAWREVFGPVALVEEVVEGLMDDQEPDQVLSEQMLVRNPTPAVSGPTHWISSSEQKLDFGLLNFIS